MDAVNTIFSATRSFLHTMDSILDHQIQDEGFVKDLRPNDTVVMPTVKMAQSLEYHLKQRPHQIDVQIVVSSDHELSYVADRLRGRPGRIVFHHAWVKDFLERQIKAAESHLSMFIDHHSHRSKLEAGPELKPHRDSYE